MRKEERGHVLAVPYPTQGHITPIHQFCKRLASKDIKVTLALTNFAFNSINPNPYGSVSFDRISDGYDHGGAGAAKTIQEYLDRFQTVGSRTLADVIIKHQSSDNPITCIVFDAFLLWALDVAKNFGLSAAPFFTQSCAVNYIYYLDYKEKLRFPIDGLSFLEPHDMPSFISIPGTFPAFYRMVVDQSLSLEKADFVLVNDFQKLADKETELLSKACPLLTVGPTVPSMYLDQRIETDNNYDISLFKTEDVELCMKWLNTRPSGSVVYVSFGSLIELSKLQMEELAWALTNFSFMWVVRSTEEAKLPSGFMEALKDKDNSLVVKWSPQLKVLSHRAIGCFLTHCGWNSTIEALSLGVPLVGMPQWSDQTTNAKYIEDIWEVGVCVKTDPETGLVKREEIEFCIREVIDGEKGRKVKENSMKWRDLAVESFGEGGTSDVNLDTFIAGVKALKS